MRHLLWFLLAVQLLIPGCAKRAEMDYGYAGSTASYDDYDESWEDEGYAEYGEAASTRSTATDKRGAVDREYAPRSEPAQAQPAPEAAPEAAPARKVHYNGYVSLLATNPEETVAQVVALAEGGGGYVERRTLTEASVRVPVERFNETWDAALALGQVLDKSLTAEDVTDAYLAVELRLLTARATRARLQELLAQATDEEEKLALLREIQRLTQAIDVQESRARTLAQLASFSRLTVRVSPRRAHAGGSVEPELTGFHWIRQLSPFRRDVAHSGRPLKLDVPEGLVALEIDRRFVAESADGAVVWSGRIPNDPQGDTGYWLSAIRERLEPEFTEAQVSQVGGFSVLRLLEPGTDAPYRYLVAVRASGRWLELVEIYYPGEAQEDRYGDAVRAALKGAGSAS